MCQSKAKKKLKYPDRLDYYRYVCKQVPMDFISETHTEYSLSLRIDGIEITPGIYENFTNLPDIEFDMDELIELYHLRWSQETAYRDLEYPLCLKAFHSKKYNYIVLVPENCNIGSTSQKLSKYAEMLCVTIHQ